jgi:hypothetical protein
MQAWCWLWHLPQFDRRVAGGSIDQCEHLRLSRPSPYPLPQSETEQAFSFYFRLVHAYMATSVIPLDR